jgi:bifunctional non-homologous end joining protein LigD
MRRNISSKSNGGAHLAGIDLKDFKHSSAGDSLTFLHDGEPLKSISRTRKSATGDTAAIAGELMRLGAPRSPIDAAALRAMKPETRERPFNHPGWVFELKYDGFRMMAAGGAGEARLFYKSGHDATAIFPELAAAVAALPFHGVVLDGEAVVLDDDGRPNFQRLQRRGLRVRHADVRHAAAASPATLFVFDLLGCEGFDLRPLPLSARKEILRRVVAPGGDWLRLSEEIPERGEDLYAAVAGMGLEGIVAKRADSPYRAGYSADWLKVRVDRSSDFAVIGFEPPNAGIRKLHLAVTGETGELVYAGTVGTGFNREDEAEIRRRLEPLRRATAPLPTPGLRGAAWVEPEVVVEVRYKEWTEGGHLRHPVFLRLRDDKTAGECFRPGEEREDAEVPVPEPAPLPTPAPAKRPVTFTNLDKVFWPELRLTKGDLIEYYRAVAPWMLPFLRDRPLVLDRFPDGIAGKSFFQKNAPDKASERLRTLAMRSEGSDKEIEYLLCDDVEGLLYLVNLGAIPFHIGASRVGALDRPDWCILDLDPKTAPFAHVVRVALAIRELCEEIGIPCHLKTSGGSGMHVLLPMGGVLAHEPVKQLAELLAGVIVARLPAIATTARAIAARRGRVYVDALQNGRGKLLAAPYCARPVPAASVSTPLDWREVDDRLDVRAFTLKTVPQRLRKRKDDPLLPVLTEQPDLERVFARLGALL